MTELNYLDVMCHSKIVFLRSCIEIYLHVIVGTLGRREWLGVTNSGVRLLVTAIEVLGLV